MFPASFVSLDRTRSTLPSTAAWGSPYAMLAPHKAFPRHFVGWNEVGDAARALIAQEPNATLLVADNFMLAAQLDFAVDATRPVYTLDSPLNAKHGRATQLALWSIDETALRAHGGRRVLLAVEVTALRERDRAAWLDGLCRRVADLQLVHSIDLFDGRKRIRFYRGRVPTTPDPSSRCG